MVQKDKSSFDLIYNNNWLYDALEALRLDLFGRDFVVGDDLRIDLRRAHSARDELVVLPAEIENQNLVHSVVLCQKNGLGKIRFYNTI